MGPLAFQECPAAKCGKCVNPAVSLPRRFSRSCEAGADRLLLGHQQGLVVGWATGWIPDHPRTESGMQLHFRVGFLVADRAAPTLAVATDTRADISAFRPARNRAMTSCGAAASYRNTGNRVRSARVRFRGRG